jgi:serine/threonine protein kinase
MGAQIKKEISIMKMVRHKYVVGMKEVLASRTKIFIVLELVTGGELFDKIVSQGRFTEDLARFYFNQLVEGVEYCHQLGVCHRDLKVCTGAVDTYILSIYLFIYLFVTSDLVNLCLYI